MFSFWGVYVVIVPYCDMHDVLIGSHLLDTAAGQALPGKKLFHMQDFEHQTKIRHVVAARPSCLRPAVVNMMLSFYETVQDCVRQCKTVRDCVRLC